MPQGHCKEGALTLRTMKRSEEQEKGSAGCLRAELTFNGRVHT